MDINRATEIAYQNGYKQGKKDAAEQIIKEIEDYLVKNSAYVYEFDGFKLNVTLETLIAKVREISDTTLNKR